MKIRIHILLASIFLISWTTLAAGSKIAVINMEKVFQGYYKTKIADMNIKKQAGIFKAYAEKLSESRDKLMDEFKELRNASQNIALSDAERENRRLSAQEKYRQLKAKETEYEQYNREKQDQLREEYEKKRESMVKEINKAIRKKSLTEGFSIVLDSSGKTLNNLPAVVYFGDHIDITKDILKEINRGHEEIEKKDNKNTKSQGK